VKTPVNALLNSLIFAAFMVGSQMSRAS
jgi:hypothetical protein